MVIHKVVGRKVVSWTDDDGKDHISVQLHCINESPSADFEGSEVEVVKCNPEVLPICRTIKIGEEIFIQRTDKGRTSDLVPLNELLGKK